MPLTPVDIHNMEFTKASLGKRGYDEEDVDALLDEAGQEMIRLLEENEALAQGGFAAAGPAAAGPSVAAELSAAAAELDHARRACDQAYRQADLVQQQLDEARRPLPGGVMDLARRTADDHLQRADQESHALIAEAREQSERMTREAWTRARDIERDAGDHHTEAVAAVQTRREDLIREIDELNRFAAGYRKALGENVLRQVDGITGSASAE